MSSFDQSLDDIKIEKQKAADEMEAEAENIKTSKEIIRKEKAKILISEKKIDALEQIMLACDAKVAAKEKIDQPEVSSLAFSNIIGIRDQQTKLKESKKNLIIFTGKRRVQKLQKWLLQVREKLPLQPWLQTKFSQKGKRKRKGKRKKNFAILTQSQIPR